MTPSRRWRRAWLGPLSAVAMLSPMPAKTATPEFAGMRAFQLSTEARPDTRDGPCAIPLAAVEARIAEQLRAARLRVVPVGEIVGALRRGAQGGRRTALEEELTALPVLASNLAATPVTLPSGEPGCALGINLHVSAVTPARRAVSAANERLVAVPLHLWLHGPRLHVVKLADWPDGLHRAVGTEVEAFLEAWRAQNPPPGGGGVGSGAGR